MKYLVTGGCGFIGSNYLRYLLKDTFHDVINVDALTYAGRLENVQDLMENYGRRYDFRHVDICDYERLVHVFEDSQPDVVVHFAAESHVDRSIENADAFVTTNVVGTYNMLEAALKVGVKKFIQIGTDEVYGQIPEPLSSKESDPLDPRSPYSASKASADLLALSYYTTHSLPVMVTRCCNNYGPYQFPEKLFPLFITNLFEGKMVPVYGDGLQVREWIHVDDHNRAVQFVIGNGKSGEIYNIGSGDEFTNIDITRELIRLTGRDESAIRHVEDRKGHDRRYSIDCSKLRELGWQPGVNFRDGLESVVSWYTENTGWWSPLKNV